MDIINGKLRILAFNLLFQSKMLPINKYSKYKVSIIYVFFMFCV